jgi:hypothetical protein
MSEHRPRRVVAKKCKSTLDADSEHGGSGISKRHINLCHLLKAHPCQHTAESTDDEIPLNIHSHIEVRGSLREHVNCMKQDQSTLTKREFTCYDVEKEAYDDRFGSFFHADWYCSVYQSKKKSVVNMRWNDWTFIEMEKNTCLPFTDVSATCGHHGIMDVMQLKYD